MHSIRYSLSIIGRMTGWEFALCVVLGLLYGPLSEIILQILYIFYRTLKGGVSKDSLTIVLMTTDPGALLTILIISLIFGVTYGIIIGVLGGVTAGVVIAGTFRFTLPSSSDVIRLRTILNIISGAISSAMALVLLILLNLPSKLGSLGDTWSMIGWVVWVAIPALLVFGTAWWTSNRVIVGVEDQSRRSNAI